MLLVVNRSPIRALGDDVCRLFGDDVCCLFVDDVYCLFKGDGIVQPRHPGNALEPGSLYTFIYVFLKMLKENLF